MKTLRVKCQNRKIPQELFPELECSDQYIPYDLKDRKFSICQRKPIGQVIQYTSNEGYINPSLSIQNQLVQAFTIYTYFTSNYTLMINHISVCGDQIIDFAINNLNR